MDNFTVLSIISVKKVLMGKFVNAKSLPRRMIFV